MSSLGPTFHGMIGFKPGRFIVSTASNTEWLATAHEFSSTVHVWRADRVVQVALQT